MSPTDSPETQKIVPSSHFPPLLLDLPRTTSQEDDNEENEAVDNTRGAVDRQTGRMAPDVQPQALMQQLLEDKAAGKRLEPRLQQPVCVHGGENRIEESKWRTAVEKEVLLQASESQPKNWSDFLVSPQLQRQKAYIAHQGYLCLTCCQAKCLLMFVVSGMIRHENLSSKV
jgi:hypothetical protein